MGKQVNIETVEKRIIASSLKSKEFARILIESLKADDFTDINKKIYNVINTVYSSELGFNNAAISVEFDRKLLDKGLIAELHKQEIQSEADYKYLVRHLADVRAKERANISIRNIENKINEGAYTTDQLRDDLEDIHKSITPQKANAAQHISVIGADFLRTLDQPPDTVLSGFMELDKTLGGFVKGEMGILAARPGKGKTSWCLAMAYNLAMQGIPVLFCGYEMSNAKMREKLLAHHGNIPYFILDKRPKDIVHRWQDTIIKSSKEMDRLPIYMSDETGSRDLKTLRETIDYYVDRFGVEVVFVDYLQKINVPGLEDNEYARVTMVSDALQQISKRKKIYLQAVCQMNREYEKREDSLPKASDLRASGQIEQDAAYIMFVVGRSYSRELDAAGMKYKFSLPFYETQIYLDKNRFSGGAPHLFGDMAFLPYYGKYVNAQWDDGPVTQKPCPQCNSNQIRYMDGKIICSSCNFNERYIITDVKSGLVFKKQEAKVYGKKWIYDYAFLHDGFQSNTILQNIRKINQKIMQDKGKPIRKISVTDENPLLPIEVGDEDYSHEMV